MAARLTSKADDLAVVKEARKTVSSSAAQNGGPERMEATGRRPGFDQGMGSRPSI
jgi:hypothetical protein